jgi:hypothetical protein
MCGMRLAWWRGFVDLPMVFAPRLVVALTGALFFATVASAKDYQLTLGPADFDRTAQVITLKLPADAPRQAGLTSREGNTIPVQISPDGEAVFVIPFQQAKETLTFLLGPASGAPSNRVVADVDSRRVRMTVGGKPAFDYQIDREALPRADIKPEFKRAGYIHPVFTPAGKIVTD